MKWRDLIAVLHGLAIGLAAACYDPARPGEEAGAEQCPTDDDDNACQVCAKQNCCAEVIACQDDPDCDCVSDCAAEMGADFVGVCMNICAVDELPPVFDTLAECGQEADCTAACE
jgi:hypothetical protein